MATNISLSPRRVTTPDPPGGEIGKDSGGTVNDNIKRWKGMFQPPEGKTIDEATKQETFKVGKVDVTSVDVQGTYLDKFPPSGFLSLPEGSWGKNGTHEVWLNHDTEWTWKNIYPSEFAVQQIIERGLWRTDGLAERVVKQLCRELMLGRTTVNSSPASRATVSSTRVHRCRRRATACNNSSP